jgi:hypothetical protein
MLSARLFIAGLAFLVVAETATFAQATEPSSAPGPAVTSPSLGRILAASNPWQSGTEMIALNLGAGSAVGIVGVTYSYMILSVLETEAGIGVGLSGLQLSVMQKIAIGYPFLRFVAGVGLSFSAGKSLGEDTRSHYFWLNLDVVGFEIRTKGRWDVFFSLGDTHVFGKPIWIMGDCEPPHDCSGNADFPQARVGVGRWF